MDSIEKMGIAPIDMVVINLYPFKQTVLKDGVTFEEIVENIDIGGPSMLRSAAKNWADVTVVCDPADYAQILAEIGASRRTASSPSRCTRGSWPRPSSPPPTTMP